jgi:hypothetical protein
MSMSLMIPKVRNVCWMVARPSYLFHWLRLAIRKRLVPPEPWISQKAIRYLDEHLRTNMKVWEWGSGHSTAWLAERVGSLVSIEHHAGWSRMVSNRLQMRGLSNAQCRYVSETAAGTQAPAYVQAIADAPDASFDLIFIDGEHRMLCVGAGLPKLRPGGILLIDNTNWMPLAEWGVPPEWPILHQSCNGNTQTTIWRKPGRMATAPAYLSAARSEAPQSACV